VGSLVIVLLQIFPDSDIELKKRKLVNIWWIYKAYKVCHIFWATLYVPAWKGTGKQKFTERSLYPLDQCHLLPAGCRPLEVKGQGNQANNYWNWTCATPAMVTH